jgi:hypothetical protein
MVEPGDISRDTTVRLSEGDGGEWGYVLWHDHTFALVKYFTQDKPVVEYLLHLDKVC